MSEGINAWVHIVAATIWVGPQFFLAIAAVPAVRTIEDARVRAQVMRVITRRFGYLAWGAMAVLVVSGVGNLFEITRDKIPLDDLNTVNYGAILSTKITLVVATIALTALHAFVLGPRVAALQESAADETEIASARRASMIVSAVNLLLALGILFTAALLNTTFALE